MSIQLPVRPARATIEQAGERLESGVATAGSSLGAVFERLGELELDEGLRDAAARLRHEAGGVLDEAGEMLQDLDVPDGRDRMVLTGATILVVLVAIASVLLVMQRRAPARRPAKRTARRRRRG